MDKFHCHFAPSWQKYYASAKDAQQDLSFVYQGIGWYRGEKSPDTMLICQHTDGGLIIYVWNGYDPRPILKHMLGYPERKI